MAVVADYVVVGAGVAGAVLARRLADAGREVALLEVGDIAAGRRGDAPARCGAEWAGAAFMPPSHDLLAWESLGWGPSGVEPYAERAFLTATLARDLDEGAAGALVVAGLQAGLPAGRPAAPRGTCGAGWAVRVASAAYLRPLEDLPCNLQIHTGTRAEHVVFDAHGAAVAVQTGWGIVRAREEVVLCAGALGTPQLLLRSGVGPRRELSRHRVDVRVELPGVGAQLLDHPAVEVRWGGPRPSGRVEPAEPWLIGSLDDDGPPALELRVVEPRRGAPGQPPPDEAGVALRVSALSARSHARVRLRSARPADPVVLDSRGLSDLRHDDERALVAGVRLARRVVAQPAFTGVAEAELAPGADVRDHAALAAWVRAAALPPRNPVGSCRIGDAGDAEAVVDAELRVRGVERLRVADASVLPGMPSVDPHLTVMAVGERAAAAILAESAASLPRAKALAA